MFFKKRQSVERHVFKPFKEDKQNVCSKRSHQPVKFTVITAGFPIPSLFTALVRNVYVSDLST